MGCEKDCADAVDVAGGCGKYTLPNFAAETAAHKTPRRNIGGEQKRKETK